MNNLSTVIRNACHRGDYELMKEVFTSSSLKFSDRDLEDISGIVCSKGHLNILKLFFENEKIALKLKGISEFRNLVKISSQTGNLEITKYLLNKTDIQHEWDTDVFSVSALYSTTSGHLNVLKYVLETFPDDLILKIMYESDQILEAACESGQLEIVKYLIDKSNLNNTIENVEKYDKFFRLAYENEKLEIIQFFIFDLNIIKTLSMEFNINQYGNNNKEQVNSWFLLRDLNQELSEKLSHDQTIRNKKVKI